MASSSVEGEDPKREIRLVETEEWWVASDVETAIASQGKTREEALDNLDEALALRRGEGDRPVEFEEDERAVLRDLGINPEEVETARDQNNDLPEFME